MFLYTQTFFLCITLFIGTLRKQKVYVYTIHIICTVVGPNKGHLTYVFLEIKKYEAIENYK